LQDVLDDGGSFGTHGNSVSIFITNNNRSSEESRKAQKKSKRKTFRNNIEKIDNLRKLTHIFIINISNNSLMRVTVETSLFSFDIAVLLSSYASTLFSNFLLSSPPH
jgi:hypothetical protein